MTIRDFLLGDWGRIVRDPIDVLRVTFIVGAVYFAIVGDVKGTANLLVAAVAVVIARLVNLPRIYDLAFVLAMYLTGWGEALGLYDAIGWYDNLVHFMVPLLGARSPTSRWRGSRSCPTPATTRACGTTWASSS